MGVIGVIILVQNGIATRTDDWGMAVAAALLSTICYGISGTYVKASPKPVEPFSNAHGSMWAATVLMVLTLPFCPAAAEPSPGVWTAVAALGVLCTGVAYLIYFRLIQDMGPISALSVTFLIPVFGILWGVLFLDEQIDWSTIIGALIVLVGTALTNGITPRFFLESGKRTRRDRPEKSQ
jgi:drug/metabolite transporter (DMT)-like permease